MRQYPQLKTDPHYNDLSPLYPFIDGDDGRGGGSSLRPVIGLRATLLMLGAG
jgi:hypothetical protein